MSRLRDKLKRLSAHVVVDSEYHSASQPYLTIPVLPGDQNTDIRILDVQHHMPAGMGFRHAEDFLPNVRTVRFLPAGAAPTELPQVYPWRVVIFTSPSSELLYTIPQRAETSVRRIVINLGSTRNNNWRFRGLQSSMTMVILVRQLDREAWHTLPQLVEAAYGQVGTLLIVGVDSWEFHSGTRKRFPQVRHLTWDQYRQSSPHVGLETNPEYRLTDIEMDTLCAGEARAIERLGL